MTIAEANPRSRSSAAASTLPDAHVLTGPTVESRPASPCPDKVACDIQTASVGATSCDRPDADDAHGCLAVAQLNGSHVHLDTQAVDAAVELLFCAAFLDDLERLRIATGNRISAFEREGYDPEPYRPQLDALLKMEHQATLALQRSLRKHPLGPWVKRTIGVGEKQGARLIAAIGDITYNHAEDRPRRGPAELWAYCGFRPDQRRRKGVKSNWNAQAKMRAFLVAESCIKHRTSPYRVDYDQARASWEHRDIADGHKHAHALRVVAKAVLRDLFLEARKAAA